MARNRTAWLALIVALLLTACTTPPKTGSPPAQSSSGASGSAEAPAQRVTLNNAALLARRVYASDLDVFDLIYAKEGNDLKRTIGRIIGLAKSRPNDPFRALKDWVKSNGTPPAAG